MRISDEIKLDTNITFTLTDMRGKVTEKRTHNVYLNYGRDWLLKLMCYAAVGGPPAVLENNRVCYMGIGIGGDKQISTIPPTVDARYPGTNVQSGTDVTVQYLERPVCVNEVGALDYWLQEITHASTAFNATPPPYFVKFICKFGPTDISYAPYYIVPMSEIGLFEYGQVGLVEEPYANVYPGPAGRPQPISYATFYSLNKTAGVSLSVEWSLRITT